MRTLPILLLLLPVLARAELNLSPREESFELEGVKSLQLSFDTGTNGEATYQPPRGWKSSGSKDTLDLSPPDVGQARAQIKLLPLETPLTLDAEGCKQLSQATVAALPEGSDKVKVELEELNPLQINGKQTYLVEVSYTLHAESFATFCLYLERKPEALRFQLTARTDDFQALRDEFRRSLFTWQNL